MLVHFNHLFIFTTLHSLDQYIPPVITQTFTINFTKIDCYVYDFVAKATQQKFLENMDLVLDIVRTLEDKRKYLVPLRIFLDIPRLNTTLDEDSMYLVVDLIKQLFWTQSIDLMQKQINTAKAVEKSQEILNNISIRARNMNVCILGASKLETRLTPGFAEINKGAALLDIVDAVALGETTPTLFKDSLVRYVCRNNIKVC